MNCLARSYCAPPTQQTLRDSSARRCFDNRTARAPCSVRRAQPPKVETRTPLPLLTRNSWSNGNKPTNRCRSYVRRETICSELSPRNGPRPKVSPFSANSPRLPLRHRSRRDGMFIDPRSKTLLQLQSSEMLSLEFTYML